MIHNAPIQNFTESGRSFSSKVAIAALFEACRALKISIVGEDVRKTAAQCRALLDTDLFDQLIESHLQDKQQREHNFNNFTMLYEEQLGEAGKLPNSRKVQGSFYTPNEVADFLVQRSLQQLDSFDASARAIDPACGAGVFLCSLFRKLVQQQKLTAEESCSLAGRLYGVDSDSFALKLAELALKLEFVKLFPGESLALIQSFKPNLYYGDSLIDSKPYETAQFTNTLNWEAEFGERGAFDLIIGNPPYGLSRGGQISPAENRFLKERYKKYRTGKLNKYIAFMGRGIEQLNANGVLAYIIPNSWLGISSGEALRRELIDNALLDEIYIFSTPVFDDPSVEAVIPIIQKREESRKHFTLTNISAKPPFRVEGQSTISFHVCSEFTDYRIPTKWNRAIATSFDKFQRAQCTLSEFGCEPRIALQAYATGKGTPAQSAEDVRSRIFDEETKIDENTYPYLKGGDISRYRVEWSGTYLRHGEFLAEPQKIERFVGPRILIREVTGSFPHTLQAIYVEEPFLYNKSILHIISDTKQPKLMQALTAILNSFPCAFYLQIAGRKTQRKIFPKIVCADLRELPIPRLSSEQIETLSELYQSRLIASQLKEQNAIEKVIDERVCQYYGLSSVRELYEAI